MSPEAKVPQPFESVADSLMAPAGPADRIMAAAYELFSQRGVRRDVGVNELIDRSGVAKATFYRHFPSKDSLVLAFLEQRDRQWTMDMILLEAQASIAYLDRIRGHVQAVAEEAGLVRPDVCPFLAGTHEEFRYSGRRR